jgi:hypothetical protein
MVHLCDAVNFRTLHSILLRRCELVLFGRDVWLRWAADGSLVSDETNSLMRLRRSHCSTLMSQSVVINYSCSPHYMLF